MYSICLTMFRLSARITAEEEDGERREYEEDGGVISDQDSDNHDDECPI